MKRRNETGFSVVEVVLALLVIGAIAGIGFWVFSRQRDAKEFVNTSSAGSLKHGEQKIDTTKPALSNLGGVYLAAYSRNTGLAGDIIFSKDITDSSKGIEVAALIFGQRVAEAGQPERINSSIDFRGLARQIDVVSAVDGTVLFLKSQPESGDYEVTLANSDNSAWLVSFDHLVELKVKRGDRVVSGQVLGKAAPYLKGTYHYGLKVAYKTAPTGDVIEYVCPTSLLKEDIKSAYEEGMNLLVRDWVTFRAKDTYGPQEGGCVKLSLKAKEVGE